MRMTRRSTLPPGLLALGLALAAGAASAQPLPQLEPGDQVRVSYAAPGPGGATLTYREVGRVVRATADTLVFQPRHDRTPVAVPVAAVTRVDLGRRAGTRTVRGIGLGFLAGAAVGGIVGAATYQKPDPPECEPGEWFCGGLNLYEGRGYAAAGGAIVGALAGAIVGGVVGSGSHRTRWEKLPLRLEAATPRHGHGVAVGVTFPLE